MSQNYLPDIPDEERHRLESLLYRTNEVERAIMELPAPNWIVLGWGRGKGHRVARARIILEHAILAAQVARYHAYMAHYEWLRLGTYSDPPNPGGARVAAYSNFTSFSLHAIAAQMHLMAAVAMQLDLLDALGGERIIRTPLVRYRIDARERNGFRRRPVRAPPEPPHTGAPGMR